LMPSAIDSLHPSFAGLRNSLWALSRSSPELGGCHSERGVARLESNRSLLGEYLIGTKVIGKPLTNRSHE
jgi:hypothetical protein